MFLKDLSCVGEEEGGRVLSLELSFLVSEAAGQNKIWQRATEQTC